MSVVEEIAAERKRQIEVEGWKPEHDDGQNQNGELARAGAAYAIHAAASDKERDQLANWPPMCWPPWPRVWWKPKDRRRDLIRSAALIVAEIERLDRQHQEVRLTVSDDKAAVTAINWNELSEFERRSCATKKRYKVEPPLPNMTFRAYHCEICEGWHLASRFKPRRAKINEGKE